MCRLHHPNDPNASSVVFIWRQVNKQMTVLLNGLITVLLKSIFKSEIKHLFFRLPVNIKDDLNFRVYFILLLVSLHSVTT